MFLRKHLHRSGREAAAWLHPSGYLKDHRVDASLSKIDSRVSYAWIYQEGIWEPFVQEVPDQCDQVCCGAIAKNQRPVCKSASNALNGVVSNCSVTLIDSDMELDQVQRHSLASVGPSDSDSDPKLAARIKKSSKLTSPSGERSPSDHTPVEP